jgi:N-acetylneuraminic acid mutarotase
MMHFKHFKATIFFLAVISFSNCFSQNGLTLKNKFPGSHRVSSSGCSANGFGFIIGGYDSTGSKSDFWKYDAANDQWIQMPNFPGGARYGAACVSVGNKIYYGTGLKTGNIFGNDFWEYDTDSDKWSQKANFPGSGRAYPTAICIKNKLYFGTGTNGSSSYSDFWEFNPDSNKWSQMASFPGIKRSSAVGFSINNYGYIGSGTNGSSKFSDFWQYNADSNKWNQIASLGVEGRSGAISFIIGNTPFVALGNGGGFKNHLLFYNVNKNTWNTLLDFDEFFRTGLISFGLGNKVYFGTGTDSLFGELYNDIWEYSPNTVNLNEVRINENLVKVFPNPNNGSFSVESNIENISNMKFEMFDQLGNLILKNEFGNQSNDRILHIQTNNLSIGVYYLKIFKNESFQIEKIIIN